MRDFCPDDDGSAEEPDHHPGMPVVDEVMLARLYREEAERLLNFLSRRLGGSEAETLHGQVWLQFFVWWQGHPEHPSPKGTLYRVAHRRVVDHRRRAGRATPVEDDRLEALSMTLRRANTGLTTVELRVDLEQALSALTARERQAVQLRHVDGFPVDTCAALMGQKYDNMRKILKTAIRKLRQSPGMGGYMAVGEAEK